MSDNFPQHFTKEYQNIYSYRSLDPVVVLLFIIFMIIFGICVIYKIN